MLLVRSCFVVVYAVLWASVFSTSKGSYSKDAGKRLIFAGSEETLENYVLRLEARLNATITTISQLQAELNIEKTMRCQKGHVNFHKVECSTQHCSEQFPITFSPYFSKPPVVLSTLSTIDSEHGSNLRIGTSVTSITPSSAVLDVHTWADTTLYGGSLDWIACPQ